jgi:oxygen-independent coproporphyrinogen III oxidase
MIGLYIHIPFCEKICHYCDFVKQVPKNEDMVDLYIEHLVNEIKSYQALYLHVDTIYIGGGTPSMLTTKQLKRLFEVLKTYQPIEYTIEVNPESYSHEKGELFKLYGINRISLGVQTFHDHHLKRLNRLHTKDMIFDVVHDLKSLGFYNISVDLIYALEHQTMEELKEDVQHLLALDLPHISLYSLILEEKTYFHHQYLRGKFEPLNEDLEAQMYEYIMNTLKQQGYDHYEISNYAKKGYESKHNSLYWTFQPFIGVGAGAHGFLPPYRTYNERALSKYMKHPLKEKVLQDEVTMRNDHLLFLLRMSEGIDLSMVKSMYHDDLFLLYPSLLKYLELGLLEIDHQHLKLTQKGKLLGNIVFMVFV